MTGWLQVVATMAGVMACMGGFVAFLDHRDRKRREGTEGTVTLALMQERIETLIDAVKGLDTRLRQHLDDEDEATKAKAALDAEAAKQLEGRLARIETALTIEGGTHR